MEEKLDRAVVTMLNGVNLEKHTPLFEKHSINWDLFLSLNEDDLKNIGIDDQEEVATLIKYMKKFRKSNKWPELEPLQLEEMNEILENTEQYLHSVNVACSYVQQIMQNGKPLDILVHSDTAASSAIVKLCERIQIENNSIIKEIDELTKDIKLNDNQTPLKKISVTLVVAGAFASILIGGILLCKKN